jgi:hypothetical protein
LGHHGVETLENNRVNIIYAVKINKLCINWTHCRVLEILYLRILTYEDAYAKAVSSPIIRSYGFSITIGGLVT